MGARGTVARASVVLFVLAVCVPAAVSAGTGFAADSSTVVVKAPKGAAKPVAGA
jgi:hypothetical protein